MSNARSIAPKPDKASLLAETVAAGLHSLAQPLTRTQWHLESAVMHDTGTGRHHNELCEALVSLEDVIAQLNFLRDIIRPFRMATKYTSESVREALLSSNDAQQEALQREGVQTIFCEGCAEATVVAPQGFVQRIAFCLFDLLRSLAPRSATFDISESDQSVCVLASLAFTTKQEQQIAATRSSSTIRSYVEVLAGDFSIAPDFSSIRISLPQTSSAI